MAVRSLNKVQLIGNLTRDPELRYTPNGTAVCSFTVATNREWTVESGEKREEAEFTRIVSWNKLAELCSQLLSKGRKVFVEGRLQTRSWTSQDGTQRTATEVVINDMIVLDSRRPLETAAVQTQAASPSPAPVQVTSDDTPKQRKSAKAKKEAVKEEKEETKEEKTEKEVKSEVTNEEVNPDDIPF